ncbi:MAG: ATP synthase F1 subunit gamma [Dehalococcoidia bacterium]|nr:ATP synthase F1 subunit gamma [Dehalococcoidia bacterium]
MPTIRQLKRRITSVQNTAKITNALQLVAASKMRRAQDRATQGRPYAEKIQGVLASLASTGEAGEEDGKHPFLVQRPVKNIGILHITPDRGLCGALNSNLNREAASFVAEINEPVSMVAVGKKGRDFFLRSELNLAAEFTELGDYPALTQTQTVAKVIMEDYLNGRVDKVFISFGEFINTVNQQPVIKQLLPVIPPEQADGEADDALTQEYIFEPNPLLVYERLLPRYVIMQVHSAILESAASEQSARMVAMKNATDNASDIESELTLTYNKVRQEQITSDLLAIVGGAEALLE